ncbi:unnamed protein product [Rotaria sp. Silwood1]|nr:unnamed protein product [Rotaria sp. Silwood1]
MSLEQQIQNESERFQALFNHLSDTQWSEAALPEVKLDLGALQMQARQTKDKINKFNATVDKEYKRLADIKGHGVRHVWYRVRGKLEQRLDEQEKTWLREFEKCKEEEQRLTVLQEQINSAQQHLHQCESAYEDYVKTKKELGELLEHYFFGVTPSYPDEDAMEQKLQMEKEHLIILQNQHRILTNTFELLQKANRALKVSLEALEDALNMNTFDLFSDSSFADMAVSSYLAKARNASAQAQQFVNEARRLYPSMPHIGDLHIKQDNLVFNVIFDNIFTDMSMRKKIREAIDRISRADAILANILSAMKQKLDKCEADRHTASKNVKRMAAEHFSARIAIVKDIIQPPPPYSAT